MFSGRVILSHPAVGSGSVVTAVPSTGPPRRRLPIEHWTPTAVASFPGRRASLPAEPGEIDPSSGAELDSLGLEAASLVLLSARGSAETDLAAGVDHPMPGRIGPLRESVQRVAHLPGVPTSARQRGHLAIRGYLSVRNAADDLVDPVAQR